MGEVEDKQRSAKIRDGLKKDGWVGSIRLPVPIAEPLGAAGVPDPFL